MDSKSLNKLRPEIITMTEEIADFLLLISGNFSYTEEELDLIVTLLQVRSEKATRLKIFLYLLKYTGSVANSQKLAEAIFGRENNGIATLRNYLNRKNLKLLVGYYLNNTISCYDFYNNLYVHFILEEES